MPTGSERTGNEPDRLSLSRRNRGLAAPSVREKVTAKIALGHAYVLPFHGLEDFSRSPHVQRLATRKTDLIGKAEVHRIRWEILDLNQ